MKIYDLPVPPELRPDTQAMDWPPDCGGYSVEQDFARWLYATDDVELTDDPGAADWHYLGPYYNRVYWNRPDDRHEPWLREAMDSIIMDRRRTFTVCEYGILGEQPELGLDTITVFSASRRWDTAEIDVPLLLHPHRLGPDREKRWLACFAGNYVNDGARWDAWVQLRDRLDVYFSDEPVAIERFVELMQESYVALAPRGVGVQSYRFYEAMQAGTVPLLISDVDGRPFKRWLDWDSCSLYRPDAGGLSDYLDSLEFGDLLRMGREARRVWHDDLRYGMWCRFVVKELEQRAIDRDT